MCKLNICDKYYVVYNSMMMDDNDNYDKDGVSDSKNTDTRRRRKKAERKEIDAGMLKGLIPESNVFIVDPAYIISTFDKYEINEQAVENDTFAYLTLSLWFANNRQRLDSTFVWVMQDDGTHLNSRLIDININLYSRM